MKAKLLFLPILATFVTTANGALMYTGGHMDAPAFGYEIGVGFEPHFHNEGDEDGAIIDGVRVETESEYEPSEVIVVVPQLSVTTLSSVNYYWLPETEADAAVNGAPFLGIGLEELGPNDWSNGSVELTLLAIRGPGDFRLWQDDGLGGANLFLANAGDSFVLSAGSHTHYNWGFAEIGTYELDLQLAGTHVIDGLVRGSATYTFQVIPEPTTAMLGALGTLALLRRRR